MKQFLRWVGTLLLLSMVPVSIAWAWYISFWLQFLVTDVILFASGMLCIATSITPPTVPPPPTETSPIRWTSDK